MTLTWEPVWAWWWIALTAVGLFAFVVVLDRAQLRHLIPARRWPIRALKIAAVLVILFALIRPALQSSEIDKTPVQILLAVDVSRSMNTGDGPGGATRWQTLKDDLARSSTLWEKLKDKVEIRSFEFDKTVRSLDPARTNGTGDMTALGSTLAELARTAREKRTAAVLLFTDGAQRAVAPVDLDPLAGAAQLRDAQTPIYPVGYGATSLSNTTFDLAVQDLSIDSVVFEKKLVPLKVQLKSRGARQRKVTVRVLVEDRSTVAAANGNAAMKPAIATVGAHPQREIDIRSDAETIPLELSFQPTMSGEQKVAVEVVAIDGELQTRNNRIETVITVRQGGLRVAYIDKRRTEQLMLRMVNGAEQIQLDLYEVLGGKFRARTIIPPAIYDRGAYDVFILGDVSADVIGPANLTALAQRVREGAGLLMTGGVQNFGAGGFATTPLADLLPVTMNPGTLREGEADLANQWTGPQAMVPTDLGLRRSVMQLTSSGGNQERWAQLAPLTGATKLVPKSDLVEIWATNSEGQPLLVASEVGRARVAAFGGDTTYVWPLHGQATEHQRFWRQMILWLARKEDDSSQAVWVRLEPRNFAPGALVPLEFGARGSDGKPLTDAKFKVEVTGPDGTVVPVAVRAQDDKFSGDFPQTDQAGDYQVRVTAEWGGQSLGLGATARFLVDPKDLELDEPNADYELLRKLADATGGQLLRSEDLDAFLKRFEAMNLENLTRVQVTPLYDNWWVLLTFVTILTAEWVLRKRAGLA